MKRRDFLRTSGWFVVGAALVGIPALDGCGDNTKGSGNGNPMPDGGSSVDPAGTYQFPQGVASADPQETTVVLWTRAVRASDDTASVPLRVQVSTDASFTTMLANEMITATAASDHTVRVHITGLVAATDYHYRFVAGQDTIAGQTRTAPSATADVQVNLAWVSCQDYGAGNYGAYRQMLVDDAARAAGDKIHAVVHLGDMIYETRGDDFQTAIDDNFTRITLKNRDGSVRGVTAFPSGGGTRAGVSGTFARTVDDYRSLYKTFFSDPDIQAARARWPFIAVWDDHEFTDDCWQSQANYTDDKSLDEGDQTRRAAGSQAWFEYVPALLTGAGGVTGVPSQAKDFATPSPAVADAAFPTTVNADNFVIEPNNVAAVGAISIYRSLRFGQHVELVMTDLRSYRSDHAIPEDLVASLAATGLFFAPRNAVPQLFVDVLDGGATYNNNAPPATIIPGVPNVRMASPAGTMLGKAQKDWWKATMKKSDATWKLWGNEVTLMRLRVGQLSAAEPAPGRVVTADAWDGYPSERKELMGYLKTEAIKNVVVLSGDIHASFAGVVLDDFDAAAAMQTPVACELVAAGISSNSLFSFFESATRDLPAGQAALRSLITVDASAPAVGGIKYTENFNMLLRDGPLAAGTFAGAVGMGLPLATAIGAGVAKKDPTINPHVRYIDSNCQGYGYVKANATQVQATIVTVNRPVMDPTDAGPGIKRTASFTIPKDNPGGMSEAVFTGTKPFPLT